MLTKGIPGYRIVVKFGYLGSEATINRLIKQKFRVYYVDESLRREVDAKVIDELAIGWHRINGDKDVFPRFTATLHGEAFSMEEVAKMVGSIGEHCCLLSISIWPAIIYRKLSVL